MNTDFLDADFAGYAENNSAGSDIVLLTNRKDYEHCICRMVF